MGERMDLDKKRVVTPEFRLSYPHLFEPQEYQGKNEFSAVAVFPKTTDLTALKKAANAAAAEKWGADMKKWPKNLKSPFRDGDKEREGTDGYENAIFITMKSKQRPHIVDRKMQDIIDPTVFQAGDYGRAEIVAAAYENQGNRGVSFWLWSIQKTKDGERFGGRQHPAQSGAFGVIEDDEPEEFGGGEGEDETAENEVGF